MTERTERPSSLLDTCAFLWLMTEAPMRTESLSAIRLAAEAGALLVSPVTAWEIGLLARPRKQGASLRFLPDAKSWFNRVMTAPGVRLAAFTPDMAIDASGLPGPLYDDPADRMIISTARHLGIPVVTRDRRIIAYARAGHVEVIPC